MSAVIVSALEIVAVILLIIGAVKQKSLVSLENEIFIAIKNFFAKTLDKLNSRL